MQRSEQDLPDHIGRQRHNVGVCCGAGLGYCHVGKVAYRNEAGTCGGDLPTHKLLIPRPIVRALVAFIEDFGHGD